MPRGIKAPRPEHTTTPDLIASLNARLTDIDRESEELANERRKVEDARLALEGRKRPGRKPAHA